MKLYHLSSEVSRPRFRMVPRVPTTGMDGENVVDKRICVGPSIASCLRATRGLHSYEVPKVRYGYVAKKNYPMKYHVYTTDAEPVEPIGVPDSDQTGELWLIRPTTFNKIGIINMDWGTKDALNSPLGTTRITIDFTWQWEQRL